MNTLLHLKGMHQMIIQVKGPSNSIKLNWMHKGSRSEEANLPTLEKCIFTKGRIRLAWGTWKNWWYSLWHDSDKCLGIHYTMKKHLIRLIWDGWAGCMCSVHTIKTTRAHLLWLIDARKHKQQTAQCSHLERQMQSDLDNGQPQRMKLSASETCALTQLATK